jgi:N-acetylglucosaminyl-diphospho-decaprenol L-rhamnosyltransferase
MKDVSVIIVNWNAAATLRACLRALCASEGDPPREIILVDNASTDGSLSGIVAEYPDLRVIQNTTNAGFACAVNQGLRAAEGQFALIMNPDVMLHPSALLELTQFMATHLNAGVAGPRLLNPDGTVQGSARRDPSARTALFGRSAPLTQLFPNNPVSQQELPAFSVTDDTPVEVDWLSGACLFSRRTAWEQVGLFDEQFFLFWEDADWCLRFRQAQWRVYYVPAAIGTHVIGVSRAKRPLGALVDLHVSAFRYYRKHRQRSALHPVTVLAGAGLMASFGLRFAQTLWAVLRSRGAGLAVKRSADRRVKLAESDAFEE